jgi:transcriptional regulator
MFRFPEQTNQCLNTITISFVIHRVNEANIHVSHNSDNLILAVLHKAPHYEPRYDDLLKV